MDFVMLIFLVLVFFKIFDVIKIYINLGLIIWLVCLDYLYDKWFNKVILNVIWIISIVFEIIVNIM